MKRALITGVTGQDGAYVSRLLLEKGYEVHGLKRRSSLLNTSRIDDLYETPQNAEKKFNLHYGDLTDGSSLNKLIYEIQPDEIYHLGAMSHVKVSFEMPEYTSNVVATGTLRLLESIRLLGLDSKTKLLHAASSEMFGNTPHIPQNEKTPHHPRSPYATSKLFAYWMAINYRESYKMFCANAVMFNHESPLRGETFVTRKISMAVAKIALGLQDLIYLGNLDAKRDWGHAEDYAKAMWLILQQDQPDDFVIATGKSYSVRDLLITAFDNVGINIRFEGEGVNEKAFVESSRDSRYNLPSGKQVMAIDPRYFRPAEVYHLQGDAAKAQTKLNWSPSYSFHDLVQEMVAADISIFSKSKFLQSNGFI
jgi:GDPmannose 4,6-dehydratase